MGSSKERWHQAARNLHHIMVISLSQVSIIRKQNSFCFYYTNDICKANCISTSKASKCPISLRNSLCRYRAVCLWRAFWDNMVPKGAFGPNCSKNMYESVYSQILKKLTLRPIFAVGKYLQSGWGVQSLVQGIFYLESFFGGGTSAVWNYFFNFFSRGECHNYKEKWLRKKNSTPHMPY